MQTSYHLLSYHISPSQRNTKHRFFPVVLKTSVCLLTIFLTTEPRMCIKVRSTNMSLNPEAQEWRPASPTPQQKPPHPHPPVRQSHQLLRHVIFPATPLPPRPPPQFFTSAATPHPPYYYCSSSQYPQNQFYHQQYQGSTFMIPYTTNTNNHVMITTNVLHQTRHHYPTSTTGFGETNGFGGGEKEVGSQSGKSPKSPHVVRRAGGSRRVFPPRLLRTLESFRLDNNKKPMLKKEWKPRRQSPKPDNGVSGDCAALPPPPVSKGPPRTTVMIKNIPNQLRREFMVKFLDGYCQTYSLEYDFLYLPMDFRKNDNLGYAFVNFTTGAAAFKFKKILQNFKWETLATEKGPITSRKICDITWARIQGKEAMIRRFQKTNFNCDKSEFLPVIFDPPRNGSDPNPAPPVTLGILNRVS